MKIRKVALRVYAGNPYNSITPEVSLNISPFLSVTQSCDETLQWTNKRLLKAGLRLVQTFDLHAARVGLHDCPCPNHGMDECDCQMVVILVYGKAEDISPLNASPVTLILHGNDGQTWLSIADTPDHKPNIKTLSAIKRTLEINVPVAGLKTI